MKFFLIKSYIYYKLYPLILFHFVSLILILFFFIFIFFFQFSHFISFVSNFSFIYLFIFFTFQNDVVLGLDNWGLDTKGFLIQLVVKTSKVQILLPE